MFFKQKTVANVLRTTAIRRGDQRQIPPRQTSFPRNFITGSNLPPPPTPPPPSPQKKKKKKKKKSRINCWQHREAIQLITEGTRKRGAGRQRYWFECCHFLPSACRRNQIPPSFPMHRASLTSAGGPLATLGLCPRNGTRCDPRDLRVQTARALFLRN